jgi:hypothetical protein
MPTKLARLALTLDSELDAALERGSRALGHDKSRAAVAREMILRSSQELEDSRSELDRYLDERGVIRATGNREEALAKARAIAERMPPGPSSEEILAETRADRF